MSSAVENTPEGNGSKALSAPGEARLEPFVTPSAETPEAPRTLASRLLDYSAHAAMIVGLVGFAWTVSNHVVSHPAGAPANKAVHTAAAPAPAAAPAATPAKTDEVADLRQANKQLADDVRRLRASVDSLRSAVHDDKTSAQVRNLQAGLDSVQTGLAASKAETSGAVAQLNSKLEKIEHEPKIQQVIDRLGKLEKSTNLDTATTASIPAASTRAAAAVPTPPAKPQPVKLAGLEEPKTVDSHGALHADDAAKPQVLPGYVVRDVYEGVALIEGKRGPMEVVPGVSIPGAGVVKSIERHGNGWTVTTTKGILAYAAPPRDVRRASIRRDYYPYREDF